jgi:hypothetical protein
VASNISPLNGGLKMNVLKPGPAQIFPVLRVSLGSVFMMIFFGLIGGILLSAGDFGTIMGHIIYLSVFLIVFTSFVLLTSRRAYLYFVLFSSSILCLVLLLWEIAFIYGGMQLSLFFVVSMAIILFGLFLWYWVRRERVRQARVYNVDSGLLNLEKGVWDLRKEFHLFNPKGRMSDIELWWKGGRWISPFGPPLGYWLSRNLGDHELNYAFSGLFLIMSSFIAWAGLSYLALVMDLREIEMERNIKIRIPS